MSGVDVAHVIRRFVREDRPAMATFAAALPEHDLLFLGRDLRHARVVEAWLDAIDEGWIDGLVAERAGGICGAAALVRDPLGWSAHVGELRLLVAPELRGRGLGRDLVQATLSIAAERGLEKVSASLTPDQTGSVALLESVGFRAEALLRRQVRGRDGVDHDLAVLSLDFGRAAARQHAYGLDEEPA